MLAFSFLLLGALVIVRCQDVLPKSGECGTLHLDYLYNQKTVTELDEFPWMGRILRRSEPNFGCLAVLISPRHMIANAHCRGGDEYAVILGEWNMANNISEPDCDDRGQCAPIPSLHEIQDIIVHGNYNTFKKINDIAVVRLLRSVNYTNYIRPICLPPPEAQPMQFVAQHLQLTGWYMAQNAKKTKTFAHIMSTKYCKEFIVDFMHRRTRDILDVNSPICSSSCRNTSEIYRSGSALMGVATLQAEPAYYYLVGIVAFGFSTCAPSVPSIATNIVAHLEWIKENVS